MPLGCCAGCLHVLHVHTVSVVGPTQGIVATLPSSFHFETSSRLCFAFQCAVMARRSLVMHCALRSRPQAISIALEACRGGRAMRRITKVFERSAGAVCSVTCV